MLILLPPDQPGSIDLLVKQYPNGKQSTHLHSLQPGDKLLFAAAIPGHAWKPTPPTSGPQRHVTLIAGGLGITPMFQLAQGILRNPSDATGLTLVVGANTDRDVLLKEELDRFEAAFPGRFRAVYTVSKPDEGSPFRRGYVDKALLEGVIPKPTEGASKDVFVCGPPAMEASLTGKGGVLEQLGFQKGRVHVF